VELKQIKPGRAFFFFVAVALYVLATAVSEEEIGLSGNDIYQGVYGSFLAAIIVFFGLPQLLYKNRYLYFIGFCLLCILAFTLADELLIDTLLRAQDDPRRFVTARGFRWGALNALFASFSITAFVAMFDNLESRRKLSTVAKLHREAELAALKSQLNPHIILNTLNNLYSLALEQNEKTPEVVLMLSNILQYSLYEANVSSAPLAREIEILRSYVALQEIGIGERAKVTFEVEGRTENRQIAPLLLLPIIENAFKHGSAVVRNDPSEIKFNLRIDGEKICLEAENPFEIQTQPTSSSGGVGLENLKERLQLLYEGNHSFSVQDTGGVFKIILTIVGDPR
jgi:hypothetical protein